MSFILGLCRCGCGESISIRSTHRPVLRKFVDGGHSARRKGNPRLDSYGYIQFKMHEHPLADSQGYVRQHRIVLENALNCCLLPWCAVHHKNGVKTDNRIENLEAMTRNKHMQIHNPIKDVSNRYCVFCGSNTTSRQNIHISGKNRWYRLMDGYSCDMCYKRFRRASL